jgi:hypothetical protein
MVPWVKEVVDDYDSELGQHYRGDVGGVEGGERERRERGARRGGGQHEMKNEGH